MNSCINRTYLLDAQDDGQRFRAKVKQKIVERQHPNDPETPYNVRFLVTFDQDKADEIVTYTEVLDHVNREIERDLNPGA